MHSHGWGGSRTTDPAAFKQWLDTGYGVLSFDRRGFGESGGKAYVENPDVEGHDVRSLVDLAARLPWVKQDAWATPRLGAFEELQIKGKPVFDALAPRSPGTT